MNLKVKVGERARWANLKRHGESEGGCRGAPGAAVVAERAAVAARSLGGAPGAALVTA